MDEDALDVAIAPEAVLERVARAIARPPKRVFGLRVEPERRGVVRGREFEVWERRRGAVHLLGRVTGKRGGSRVEFTSALTRRARVLMIVFFVLFTVFAYGVMTGPGRAALTPWTPLLALGAALAIVLLFRVAARAQARDLRAFVRHAIEATEADAG